MLNLWRRAGSLGPGDAPGILATGRAPEWGERMDEVCCMLRLRLKYSDGSGGDLSTDAAAHVFVLGVVHLGDLHAHIQGDRERRGPGGVPRVDEGGHRAQVS